MSDERPRFQTPATQWLAQMRAAETWLASHIKDLEAAGFVQEAPGIWVKRDAEGKITTYVSM